MMHCQIWLIIKLKENTTKRKWIIFSLDFYICKIHDTPLGDKYLLCGGSKFLQGGDTHKMDD